MSKQRIISTLLILALVAGGIHLYRRYRIAPEVLITDIQVTDLNGKTVDHARGQNTILVFFATWCPDCRRELPVLAGLENLLVENNISVVLVSDEPEEKLKMFSTTLPARFSILHLKSKFSDNGIYTLPTTYLFCKDGSTYLKQTGAIEWSTELLTKFATDCSKN